MYNLLLNLGFLIVGMSIPLEHLRIELGGVHDHSRENQRRHPDCNRGREDRLESPFRAWRCKKRMAPAVLDLGRR